MSLWGFVGSGEYRANERWMLLAEHTEIARPGSMPACIHSTGYTGRPDFVNRSTVMDRDAPKVITKTHSMLSIDAGGTATFGNDTAIQAIGQAVAWHEGKGRVGPYLLSGTSMGFCDLMAWARTNQNKVKAAVGFTPAVNFTQAWQENRDGLKAVMDAAYGGLYDPAVHGPTHDPMMYGAQLDFPILIFSAADDTLTTPADHAQFAQVVGPNCKVVNVGSVGGHVQAAVTAGAVSDHLAKFLLEHR